MRRICGRFCGSFDEENALFDEENVLFDEENDVRGGRCKGARIAAVLMTRICCCFCR